MKRHPGLRDLSVDHHHGLVQARRLRSIGEGGASGAANDQPERIARGFLLFFDEQANHHFREEEEVLLPAFARFGDPSDPAVVRVLVEHVRLRRLASDLERQLKASQVSLQTATELGTLLNDHIRYEEQTLFPLIERTMPDEALYQLGEQLIEHKARESYPGHREPRKAKNEGD